MTESVWGVEHGLVSKAVGAVFNENQHVRDQGGKFANKSKSAFERNPEATVLGGAATIGAGLYARRMGGAINAAAKMKDPAHAARTARAWSHDVGESFPKGNAKPSDHVKNLKDSIKHTATPKGAESVAATKYARTMEGVKRLRHDNSGRADWARKATPSYHENRAFGRLLDRHDQPNKTRLFRGIGLDEKAAGEYANLKPGDRMPGSGYQSWSEDEKIARYFQDALDRKGTPAHRKVRFVMEPGEGRALNIQRKSGMKQKEWLSSGDHVIHRIEGDDYYVRRAPKERTA